MSKAASRPLPPDQAAREQALDPRRSILVQAPAGSGKTDLLTRRFLRLLSEVDEPGQIVAITFTKAAAAEMRHRILAELENAAAREAEGADGFEELSMEALAAKALHCSRQRAWNLIELPAQLRISTIDSFCRELALQQPLLSGLGGSLEIFENPQQLYRRAARTTLEQIDHAEPRLRAAIEALLLWRDNGWQEMENLLVQMLAQRDRWMHDFVLEHEQDWDQLRKRLEQPFARAVRSKLTELSALLDRVQHARAEALTLARFACEQTQGALHRELAELAGFPIAPFDDTEQLEAARQACACLANLLQTQKGEWRSEKGLHANGGFPATDPGRAAKKRFAALIADLRNVSGLEETLASIGILPPARYSEEEWTIVRACFALLRHAAAQLKVVFADAAAVDYTEVAQIAQQVLKGEEGIPGEAPLAIADEIRHLLVDEFQDTSRRQHELLRRLIAAWPGREGRTCFVVGDPMQSIYFFRDADAELFPRVRDNGLEIPEDQPLRFHPVALAANFRTEPCLVGDLNGVFEKVFAKDDGSGVTFAPAKAARHAENHGPQLVTEESPRLNLRFNFMPQNGRGGPSNRSEAKDEAADLRDAAGEAQRQEIVELIRNRAGFMERARHEGRKYRIAILARTHASLRPIAEALRVAAIPFRAVELENLNARPEVADALALARALLNPYDRISWLGVLRAPWCSLSLADLYLLAGADDVQTPRLTIPEALAHRAYLLSEEGGAAARRVQLAIEAAAALRAARPALAFGTWLEQVWLSLGGDACVSAAAKVNLDLLWSCLDGLPNGEQDLLGPALDAALDKLTALPDPAASSDCGVQLMTIHKAKGLEFEMVIVPELQARSSRASFHLLSWLERGLEEPDESGEATEFLIAPLSAKGAGKSPARTWVDAQRHHREKQENRRLLYVAATRARDELHFFARPEYKIDANGAPVLIDPGDCLLATAWPALEEEVRRQFDEWKGREAESSSIASIAAGGEEDPIRMPQMPRPTILHRLPPDYRPAEPAGLRSAAESISGMSAAPFYRRHEGGLLSRALGVGVHSFLEELARLRDVQGWDAAREGAAALQPKVATQIRAAGVEPAQANGIASQALEIALKASRDPVGQWILAPHDGAGSELRWAGIVGASVQEVQVDRVFRAGPEPGTETGETWWIIDYKTAHPESLDSESRLLELREIFAPQLEAYARVLRNLRGVDATICAAIYYPRMLKLDWWEA